MLDTDSMSYLMKKSHAFHRNIMQRVLKEEEGAIAISTISVSEISFGIERLQEQDRKKNILTSLEYILSSIVVLEYNDDAAWEYGKIRATLCNAGQDIGIMDCLIAAHAVSQNIILVSNNLSHFQRIKLLKVETWVS
jgi:tRNA(fMet)-specific endonuclease VapC